MKRWTILAALVLMLAAVMQSLAEAGAEKALTVMIYMCGSDLESKNGSASTDIEEIRASGVNTQAVDVLLLTGGSAHWHTDQDSSTMRISRLEFDQDSGEIEWTIKDTQPSRSMGDKATLVDFIDWSVAHCPAEQYALILWDHGNGPLEGICVDELHAPDDLSIDELVEALSKAQLPDKLSWIGMDACFMATAEVAKAVSPYARYMIASQDEEPPDGWDYSFLSGIEADEDGHVTGRRIVDAYFNSQSEDTMGLTLSCLDLSRIDGLVNAMNDFFEPIGRSMNKDMFAALSTMRTESASFGGEVRGLTTGGYDLVDLGDLISHYSSTGNYSLQYALESVVSYKRPNDKAISGLSVYHPLRNKNGYRRGWKQRYSRLNFSEGYKKYLNSFGTILMDKDLADWSQIALSDDGLSSENENRFSMRLTPVQLENFASAQLIVLGAIQEKGYGDEEVYDTQLSEAGAETGNGYSYYPVFIDEVTPDADGLLSARYTGRSLYLTDESGRAVAGPIGYQRSDDGKYWYIRVRYYDWSGREDAADGIVILYTCVLDEDENRLKIVNTEVYDTLTKTYTRRISFDESDYTDMYIERLACALPKGEGALRGFGDWEHINSDIMVSLPLQWHLRFFDAQMSGTQLYATLQITNVQQNSYCTPPIRVENPNLYNIDIQPRQITGNGYELTLYAVQDNSPLNPGLNIGATFKNTSHQALTCEIDDIVLNGYREAHSILGIDMSNVAPGQTTYDSGHISLTELAGMEELTELSFELSVRLANASYSTASRFSYSVSLSGCGAFAADGAVFAPLDEVVRGGETWQLLDLHRNAGGGLSGTLRVVNDTDSTIFGFNYLFVNDRLQTDETLFFSVDPHMDICVPFEIPNSAVGHELTVKGAKGTDYRYMRLDHLMERFGITEVTSLKLCRVDDDHPEADSIAFEWAEPIPIASPGDMERYPPLGEAQRLLLDGDFTVNVDRLLAADNGVALRLLITNHTDKDLNFYIKYPELNGERASWGSWSSNDTYEYAVGAGATHIANIAMKRSDLKAVSELGMCFRYGDFTTHIAKIMLDDPVPIGAEGGIYLSGSQIRTIPSDNVRPGLNAVKNQPESIDIEGVALNFTASLVNDGTVYSRENVDDSAVLKITLRADNQSGKMVDLNFDDFTVNGTRFVDGRTFIYNLASGETGTCAVEIRASQFADMDQVSAVGCKMELQLDKDWRNEQECMVHFDLCGIPLAGAVPEIGETLGEAKSGDVTLRLMSLREDDRGRLKGVLYLRNDSDAPLEKTYAHVYVNGVQADYVSAMLPEGFDRLIDFTFSNEVSADYWSSDFGGNQVPDMTHLLQRMGADAVNRISLCLDDSRADGMVTVRLNAPMPLTRWEWIDMAKLKPLLEGETCVGVNYVTMTQSKLFLTLVLFNDTTVPHVLTIAAMDADGRALEMNGSFTLAPRTIQVVNARFMTDKSLFKGDNLKEITLSFGIDGELVEGAMLRLNAPMKQGQPERRGIDAFTTIPAQNRRPMPAILESVGVPGTDCVFSTPLTVTIDAQRAERFVGGYAVVCMKDEKSVKDETGEYNKLPCLRELCRIPLSVEGEQLTAPYSGMVLWSGHKTLSTQEIPLDDGGTALCAEAVLYSPDRSYDSGLSERLSERGYGVLLEGRWTVDGTGSEPVIQEARWTPRNLNADAQGSCEMPPAAEDWRVYYEQALHFDGHEDIWDVDYLYMTKRLTLIPIQTLNAELAVRYEIAYADGNSEVITVDDNLAAIWEAMEARAKRAEYLGEAEPDGGGCIPVTPGSFETDRFCVSVSARLKLGESENYYTETDLIKLGLCMKVENRSDIDIDAISTNLVLNGEYETGTRWQALSIKPASTSVDTWYIDPEDLLAVGDIHRIQCTLNLFKTGKDVEVIETIPIDVALEPMDETALWEHYAAVGETNAYGITWQLLSAEIDEYGRVTGELYATNHTSNTWNLNNNAVLANGFRATSIFSDTQFKPHESKKVFFSFENFVWADCYAKNGDGEKSGDVAQTPFILQSHGVQEVTELTFVFDLEHNYNSHLDRVSPSQMFTFTLPEPLAVPSADNVMPPQKLLMREDGLSVWLESVLLGDETLSLALEVHNDTDDIHTLLVDHLNVNGSYIYYWEWKDQSFSEILPHTTQNCCITIFPEDSAIPLSGGVLDMHICFWVDSERGGSHFYRGARVYTEDFLKQSGDLVYSAGCEVSSATFAGEMAPSLTDRLCFPPAAGVNPGKLIPPVSAEKAALFESGEASICIRQEYDDDNDYIFPHLNCATLSKEIVSLPLDRDESGTVVAQYSGMILSFYNALFPMRERTSDGETEINAIVYLIRDYYDDYELRNPGTGGETPDIVPVGELYYSMDESDAPFPFVKAELHYRIGKEGNRLVSHEEVCTFIDMETDTVLNCEVNDVMYSSMQICNAYCDDCYDRADPICAFFGYYDVSYNPSLLPIEHFFADDGRYRDLVIRYHLRYADGSEEIIVEPYCEPGVRR